MVGIPNNNTAAATDWREYSAEELTAEQDIQRPGGSGCRMIILKTTGDLVLRTLAGAERTLTGLPAGYVHEGQASAILPGTTAALVVYW